MPTAPYNPNRFQGTPLPGWRYVKSADSANPTDSGNVATAGIQGGLWFGNQSYSTASRNDAYTWSFVVRNRNLQSAAGQWTAAAATAQRNRSRTARVQHAPAVPLPRSQAERLQQRQHLGARLPQASDRQMLSTGARLPVQRQRDDDALLGSDDHHRSAGDPPRHVDHGNDAEPGPSR